MFADSSRYAGVDCVDVVLRDGRSVRSVRLRRLPELSGELVVVKGNDRLDIVAQRRYGAPTRFWHIADANAELQANRLVATPNRTIKEPTS